MSNTSSTGTVNVGRLTITSHRGHTADALCFRPLCFSSGHGHGHGGLTGSQQPR